MSSTQSEFSGTPAKPSVFRYFAKDLDSTESVNPSINVVQLGDHMSYLHNLESKPAADIQVAEPFVKAQVQSLDEENAIRNIHSLNQFKASDEIAKVSTLTDRVEIPAQLSNALEELTHSVENIISSLPVQVDMNAVWQPLVQGMKQMSEKRERLLEIEKMFDHTVDEMNKLRESMCVALEDIKSSEIERAKSLQARLQLATSLQEKLKAI